MLVARIVERYLGAYFGMERAHVNVGQKVVLRVAMHRLMCEALNQRRLVSAEQYLQTSSGWLCCGRIYIGNGFQRIIYELVQRITIHNHKRLAVTTTKTNPEERGREGGGVHA